jgi:hypothetical protein
VLDNYTNAPPWFQISHIALSAQSRASVGAWPMCPLMSSFWKAEPPDCKKSREETTDVVLQGLHVSRAVVVDRSNCCMAPSYVSTVRSVGRCQFTFNQMEAGAGTGRRCLGLCWSVRNAVCHSTIRMSEEGSTSGVQLLDGDGLNQIPGN